MGSFAVDKVAMALTIPFCLFCYLLNRYRQTVPMPQILVATLKPFSARKTSWRERYCQLPRLFKLIALLALLLAFIDPRLYIEHEKSDKDRLQLPEKLATQGIALYLVLDQSGSMSEKVAVRQPSGGFLEMPKIELMKQTTESFVKGDRKLGLRGRPNDLIGLVEFARTAQVVVPLTLDRKALLDALSNFDTVSDPSMNGTAIGYAILKTAQLIEATRSYARDLIGQGKPAYEIKSSAIILVTDGMQDPNPADKGSKWRHIDPIAAAKRMQAQGIRVYVVNIDPRFTGEQFAPHRRQLQKAAEITGGKLFMLEDSRSLTDIYASIDALEKSSLPLDDELIEGLKQKLSKDELLGIYRTIYIAPYLIALAIACLFVAVFLEATLLRRVP